MSNPEQTEQSQMEIIAELRVTLEMCAKIFESLSEPGPTCFHSLAGTAALVRKIIKESEAK